MRHRIANNFPIGPALLALTVLAALLMATAAAGNEFARPGTQPAAQPATQPATRTSPPLPGLTLPLVMTANPPASTAPAASAATQPSTGAATAIASSALDSLAINRGGGSAAPTTQPTAQAAAAPSATSFEVGRVVMSLLAVIALILFLKWGSKKVFTMPSSGGTAVMQVVSRTTLAPRQQLLLVRVGRRLMVIGDSAGRLSGLGEIADPDEVASLIGQTQSTASSPAATTSFTNMFRRFSGRSQQDASWDELQQDSSPALIRERSGLLGEDRDGGAIAVADGEMDDLPEPDRPASPGEGATAGEIEAQKAVEAARYDIQALRAKLREVTGRLNDPPAA